MGASQSSATVENVNNTLVVNKSTMDLLNEQNTTIITDTVIENAKTATASIVQQQNLSFTKLRAKGDINISGVTQKQEAAITFKNVNIDTTTNEASNNILTNMMNNLSSSVDNDVLSKMLANAESATKTAALSMPGWADSSSTALNTNTTDITNTTDYKLRNIISNTIQNNFTTKNVSNCISTVTGSQNILVSDLISSDGSINITSFSQEQAATLMAECISQSGVTNSISTALQNTFGITIVDDKTTSTSTEQTSTATATTESTGILDSLLSAYSTYMIISIASSSLCCFLIISVIILIFVMRKRSEA